jgi:DNA-binding NarL/FixJ family response regulator
VNLARRTLTPREAEVAVLIAEGLTNVEIGQRLALVTGTVANHIANAMKRLGARNRAQLAVWAVEQGLYRSQGSVDTKVRRTRTGRAADRA